MVAPLTAEFLTPYLEIYSTRGRNFDPHPSPSHLFAQDLVWRPGAALKDPPGGGRGSPGEPGRSTAPGEEARSPSRDPVFLLPAHSPSALKAARLLVRRRASQESISPAPHANHIHPGGPSLCHFFFFL